MHDSSNRIISILYKMYTAANRSADSVRDIFSQLSCRAHFLQPRYRQDIMFPRYTIYGKVTVLNLGERERSYRLSIEAIC